MQLTGLCSLSLVALGPASPPTPLPDALSRLTGLRKLRISHGLTQAS